MIPKLFDESRLFVFFSSLTRVPVLTLQPQTPKSDSKKVTFGLTNNKTAGETVKAQSWQ